MRARVRRSCTTTARRTGPSLQTAAAEQIVRRGLTVRATEQFVADTTKNGTVPAGGPVPASKKAAGKSSTPEIDDLEERLRERFATKVAIHHGDKKGRIEIEYYGNTDLDRVLTLLGLSSRYDML